MSIKAIPDGYHSITPYLTINNASQVIDFLKKVFDSKEIVRMAKPDGTIMHAEVKIGDSIIMLGEALGDFKPMPGKMHLYLNDVDKTYARALEAGAISLREPTDQFYGDRMAGVQDRSGNQWWIATHVEDVTPEEMKKRSEAFIKKQDNKS